MTKRFKTETLRAMLYFAYGPNMDEERLKAPNRCPGARFIFKALLPGYRLVFIRRGENGNGTAHAAPDPGAQVWGVVYDITDSDREGLHTRDTNAQRAYRPREVMVHPNGDFEQRITVVTFTISDPSDMYHPPDRQYLDHLLRGARQWVLPTDYIAQLEHTKVA